MTSIFTHEPENITGTQLSVIKFSDHINNTRQVKPKGYNYYSSGCQQQQFIVYELTRAQEDSCPIYFHVSRLSLCLFISLLDQYIGFTFALEFRLFDV